MTAVLVSLCWEQKQSQILDSIVAKKCQAHQVCCSRRVTRVLKHPPTNSTKHRGFCTVQLWVTYSSKNFTNAISISRVIAYQKRAHIYELFFSDRPDCANDSHFEALTDRVPWCAFPTNWSTVRPHRLLCTLLSFLVIINLASSSQRKPLHCENVGITFGFKNILLASQILCSLSGFFHLAWVAKCSSKM